MQSFGPGELSYTFVIETDNGRTLVHPQLPEPAAIRQEPVVIIISDLETSPGKIQRLLLRLLQGEGTFVIGRGLQKGGSSVNVLQIVASEQAPGERETAREPLSSPRPAPRRVLRHFFAHRLALFFRPPRDPVHRLYKLR